MLGLFSKKQTLCESGVFDCMTDWHCHLLPGVDDGVRTMDESLAVLARYEQLGIKEVWLTPHIMEDFPNTPDSLRQRYAELVTAYQGGITLHLAAENMMDNLFDERLERGELLPLGEDAIDLLVETSYFNPPSGMTDILRRVKSAGYFPMLAHPERYAYMDKRDYRRLKGMDVKFQLNLFSLVGAYGEEAKDKAEWLYRQGMYDIKGTDTHRLRMLDMASEVKTAFIAKYLSRC